MHIMVRAAGPERTRAPEVRAVIHGNKGRLKKEQRRPHAAALHGGEESKGCLVQSDESKVWQQD